MAGPDWTRASPTQPPTPDAGEQTATGPSSSPLGLQCAPLPCRALHMGTVPDRHSAYSRGARRYRSACAALAGQGTSPAQRKSLRTVRYGTTLTRLFHTTSLLSVIDLTPD